MASIFPECSHLTRFPTVYATGCNISVMDLEQIPVRQSLGEKNGCKHKSVMDTFPWFVDGTLSGICEPKKQLDLALGGKSLLVFAI